LLPNVEDIIEGCKKDERKAQEMLYQAFSKKLFGTCLRYAGNYEEARDVLHEGFIKIFQHIKQLRVYDALEGWMRRIMINTALEKYRHKIDTDPIDKVQISGHEESFDIVSEISEKDLLGLIQLLSPQYRMVFNLYAIEGYNHKEIAEMLHISEGTSKSNLSRARVILQDKVRKFYSSAIMMDTEYDEGI
jgi:RNA polymerase sigma factor (sigma-70 family)